MKIAVKLENRQNYHQVRLQTGDAVQSIAISSKPTGFGSSVNGGELLFLALATCYCNDIYREAVGLGIQVEGVEVEVEGEFGGVGEPARSITYHAKVSARAEPEKVLELMRHTDRVAEIQNTLRAATPVVLGSIEVLNPH